MQAPGRTGKKNKSVSNRTEARHVVNHFVVFFSVYALIVFPWQILLQALSDHMLHLIDARTS
jgi:hypothetical protein